MKKKIGVYICACGGNISDYVDIEKVREVMAQEEGVFLAKTTMFACGDSNQNDMVNDIKSNELDSVVVASCSPKLHLLTFRNVSERAGLNKYNYIHANIREQASWAHSDDKIGATEKAILLVKAAIAKARHAESHTSITIESKQAVAVIGAGVAGLNAAISLAEMGTEVHLIEKEHFVGGRIREISSISPENESGEVLVKRLYQELINNKNITLHTGSEVIEQNGNIGDFKLTLLKKPRLINNNASETEIMKAISVCPQVVDEPNSMGTRKAIYSDYLSKYPPLPAIDNTNCTGCGLCKDTCSDINLSQETETIQIHVGSILVSTGFDSYTPNEGEFGYQQIKQVITLPQFKDLISKSNNKLIYNNKEVNSIAYIYCVGSRQVKGENKYCSRYCCTANIQAAIDVKEKFPNIQNYHFTRGVRTYGKQELKYAEALKQGDLFIQFPDKQAPEVVPSQNQISVKANDILSGKKTVEAQVDLVVLVTGMVPRKESAIGSLLKLPKGRDAFFNEIHMKLRPVETVIDGITIAGTCQGPKNTMESMNSALAAAAKSYSYVSKGRLELEPIIAYVDKEACSWCNACTEACPFSAIIMIEENGKAIASISSTSCKGCGMCLPVCPTNALELTSFTDREMLDMIKVLSK